ncbi:probable inactive leucine-rich repeat receptor-like protein kinase At3g03770 [Henckelia pumila]|uniref:probable inactive leucine-rich repeat receptor-like protein kinase At3g03770 n=1 Tax=Henckelia pumila TaxID=405737 RepID=UPI003C6E1DEC
MFKDSRAMKCCFVSISCVASMYKPSHFALHFLSLFLLISHYSEQLQPSQSETLLKIKKQFNFPPDLSGWNENPEFCNSEPTQILTLSCYEDNITQFHLTGNRWFPNLIEDFSTSSLFLNLAGFPSLKVLSLVSLGLRGPLPSEIGRLSSLEILNISSNSFDGPIPAEISFLKGLQTLVMDNNRFAGQVPEWLGFLPALSVLILRNNSLNGSFPIALSALVNLRILELAENNLSGLVPKLDKLANLQVLDLEGNFLGPESASFPKKLVSLVLKKNKFQFPVSDELISCYQLQKLDISLNEFVGPFPQSLLTMPTLTYLNIGGNRFTGKLLHNMPCNAQLKFLNLSENHLTGDLPDCLEHESKERVVLYGGNCLSKKYRQQHVESFCHSKALAVRISPRKKEEKRPYSKAVLASSMVGGVVVTMAIFGVAFLLMKKESLHRNLNKISRTRLIVDRIFPGNTLQLLKDARYISETMKLGALGIPPYRTFVLDELKEATNNFNASNVIGEGSNGQVYKGWLTDGTIVAIRTLKVKKRHGVQSYTNQLELVQKLRHCHLVSAIGHCFHCCPNDSSFSRIFLVFEYVPNGTLRRYISEVQSRQKFTWTQRIAAAIEVARGIQFLHTGNTPGVYLNHLKITDVLVDQNLHVKINKYNLQLLAENRRSDEIGISPRGSKENMGSILNCEAKNDVYDFGVILLEMAVGRAIVSMNDIHISKDILSVSLTADAMGRKSVVDPSVSKECSDDSLKTVMEVSVRCLSNEECDRPSLEDIIWNLQFAAQLQQESNSNQETPCVSNPSSPLTLLFV